MIWLYISFNWSLLTRTIIKCKITAITKHHNIHKNNNNLTLSVHPVSMYVNALEIWYSDCIILSTFHFEKNSKAGVTATVIFYLAMIGFRQPQNMQATYLKSGPQLRLITADAATILATILLIVSCFMYRTSQHIASLFDNVRQIKNGSSVRYPNRFYIRRTLKVNNGETQNRYRYVKWEFLICWNTLS